MSDLARVTPGVPLKEFPGATWNSLVEAEERNRARAKAGIRGPQGTGDPIPPSPVRILVKNESGSAVSAGGVLKLADVLFNPADRPGPEFVSPVFKGSAPEADSTTQQVAITCERIASGAVGWTTAAGLAWAKLNITDSAHTFAKPKASTAELESDASTGFPVVWKDSGTGSKWAVVSLSSPGGSTLRWGEATTSIGAASGWAAADRGTFTIQFYDDGGDPDGDPVDGENLYPSSFDNGSVCCVDTKFTPVRLVTVACDLMSE